MHTGLAVITGTEDRQHAYVALSRGTDVNMVTKALRRLADDGLVEIVPSWGTFRARS